MTIPANHQLQQFVQANHLNGLTQESLTAIIEGQTGYTVQKAQNFLRFQQRINKELLRHTVIRDNAFTKWFEKGKVSHEQAQAFIVQFSVFSNLFLVAQLLKTINADTLEGMRASKEILANEIGVVYNASGREKLAASSDSSDACDPALVSTEGTIEGGRFRFQAAHFEWLLRIAEKLGLGFNDLGKRHHGTASTLHFCDELARLYGSEQYLTSQAASYAVENWAAAGFWGELIRGFDKYNRRTKENLPLSFFTWHNQIEAQHALHTQEELEELYFCREINEDAFIATGNEMLDAVAVFWNGLNDLRSSLEVGKAS
jgi:pyrroloquinoline quinone (PQQ) biosynthesis protein C